MVCFINIKDLSQVCYQLKMDLKYSICLLLFLSGHLINTVQAVYTLDAEAGHCSMGKKGAVWICNYIPQDIPKGFESVFIEIVDQDINCTTLSFQSNSWQQVKTLKLANTEWETQGEVFLHASCFRNLINLEYLSINIDIIFYFNPNVFLELPTVRELSLAHCDRLDWYMILDALNGSNKLSNLTDLDLSSAGIIAGSVEIGKTFVDVIDTRNITKLNLSGLQVSFLNITTLLFSLKYLNYINCSSMNLNALVYHGPSDVFERIKMLDISNMTLPKSTFSPKHFKIYNVILRYENMHKSATALFSIQQILANSTFSRSTYELFNCELRLDNYIPMKTETLSIKSNYFKHLDINVSGDIKYRNTTIKNIDVSNNEMNFLHPSILTLFPNLISLRASKNKLNLMLNNYSKLFEKLFISNTKLQLIDLSENGLSLIATELFVNNFQLEEIILSYNLLEQVQWKMDNFTNLKILDLSNNRIVMLDSTSLVNLDSLISSLPSGDQLVLKMENNPLSCSQCKSKSFITWLTKTKSVNLSSERLTCTQEGGEHVYIDDSVVLNIESICFRRTIITLTSVTLGTVFICAVLLTIIILHRRKLYNKQLKRNQLLANIQQGEGVYEFVTMLSYNNQEEDFIRQYVLEPLNQTLQTMTGVDRELVLTGDQHFRPGFMVNNEIASSLERVSLVLMLITNEFCTSGYCLSEVDQAWMHRKPMIFMFKEDVDENLMTPIMKTIYKKNVRILWTLEDEEYVLKTTWDNVGTAIIDLISK